MFVVADAAASGLVLLWLGAVDVLAADAALEAPFFGLGTLAIGVMPSWINYSLRAATSAFNFSIMSCISLGERITLAAALFLIFLAR